jgi:hypothetical protein
MARSGNRHGGAGIGHYSSNISHFFCTIYMQVAQVIALGWIRHYLHLNSYHCVNYHI